MTDGGWVELEEAAVTGWCSHYRSAVTRVAEEGNIKGITIGSDQLQLSFTFHIFNYCFPSSTTFYNVVDLFVIDKITDTNYITAPTL